MLAVDGLRLVRGGGGRPPDTILAVSEARSKSPLDRKLLIFGRGGGGNDSEPATGDEGLVTGLILIVFEGGERIDASEYLRGGKPCLPEDLCFS